MGIYEFIGTIIFIYAIANLVGVVPIFVSMTHDLEHRIIARIIGISAIAVGVLLAVSVLVGE